jgi:hypothetical protein
MDGLTFIAEMIKALAWPLAAVAIALIFRQQLGALLRRMSQGRLGPAEVEFEFEQELRVLAAQSCVPAEGAVAVGAAMMPSAGAGRQAILGAWRNLQHRAQAGMHSLAACDVALYRRLRSLSDLASQRLDFKPSPESVAAYVQLARGLQARLEQARVHRADRGHAG